MGIKILKQAKVLYSLFSAKFSLANVAARAHAARPVAPVRDYGIPVWGRQSQGHPNRIHTGTGSPSREGEVEESIFCFSQDAQDPKKLLLSGRGGDGGYFKTT